MTGLRVCDGLTGDLVLVTGRAMGRPCVNTAADSILFGGAREWINGSFGLLSMEMRGQIGKWASEDARAVSRHWQFSGQTIRSADGRRQ